MDLPIEFRGCECDWFANDSKGHFALFATAGEGFIPEEVAMNFGPHLDLSESIGTPHLGTPQIWADYASKGLYVFDWDLPGGPYRKVASPTGPLDHTIESELMKIAPLPAFDGSFDETSEIWRTLRR